MHFIFPKGKKDFAKSLSAVIPVGDDLWLGGDEGTEIACVRPSTKDPTQYEPTTMLDLVDELDLPDKATNLDNERSEVDLEGADWEAGRGYLWVLGSHSLKRAAAKIKDKNGPLTAAQNLVRLVTVSADGNRFLLGRIPLVVKDGRSEPLRRGQYTKEHFGARLDCTNVSSELLDALRTDPILGRFLLPGHELPGKDNGIDFEGLAFEPETGRLLVGLRGPVLRGMAVILELMVDEEFRGPDQPGRLRLRRIGAAGQRYRRHFLDLDGLSIRDLCVAKDDLLILAGPTMAIDWPVTIYRWKDGRKALAKSEEETFVWQESGEIELIKDLEIDPPGERGSDRAEGIALRGKDRIIITFDSPSSKRFEKPATVRADEITLK